MTADDCFRRLALDAEALVQPNAMFV